MIRLRVHCLLLLLLPLPLVAWVMSPIVGKPDRDAGFVGLAVHRPCYCGIVRPRVCGVALGRRSAP